MSHVSGIRDKCVILFIVFDCVPYPVSQIENPVILDAGVQATAA